MSYAVVIGAGVAMFQAEKQSQAAETGAFWMGNGGGGGGMFQGDFNVNLAGSGTSYQSLRGGGESALAVDPVLLMAAALGVVGLIAWSKK